MSMDLPKIVVDLNNFSKLAKAFLCDCTISVEAYLIGPYAAIRNKIPFPKDTKNLRKAVAFRR